MKTFFLSPLRSMAVAILVGMSAAIAIAYVVAQPVFTHLVAEYGASVTPSFSMIAIALTIGVTLFFKAKIESFLNSVLITAPERYANRAI